MRTHGDCCSYNCCFRQKVGQSANKKVSTNCFASIVGTGSFDLKVESNIEKKALKTRYSEPYLHQLLLKFGIAFLLLWCRPTFRGHSLWTGLAMCRSLFAYQWFPAQAFRCRSLFLLKFVQAHLTGLVIVSFQMETSLFCRVKIICSLGSTCGSWYWYWAFQSDLLALAYLLSVDIAPNYFSIKHLLINYFHD